MTRALALKLVAFLGALDGKLNINDSANSHKFTAVSWSSVYWVQICIVLYMFEYVLSASLVVSIK